MLLHGPNAAEELVTHLRHDPVDLLVVGSHGHGMVRDLLLGQTVDRVRHRLEVPMLIARPDRGSARPRRNLAFGKQGRRCCDRRAAGDGGILRGYPLTLAQKSPYNPLTIGKSRLARRIAGPRATCEHAMPTTYFKRFRMEIELDGAITGAPLPRRFVWVPWSDSLVEQHSAVKYQSFAGEVDAYIFPCLGDLGGCRRLMCEIRRKPGFPSCGHLARCLRPRVRGRSPGSDRPGSDRRHSERGGAS